jgi:hypothetical protein
MIWIRKCPLSDRLQAVLQCPVELTAQSGQVPSNLL